LVFLVETMTPKRHFEINWPLGLKLKVFVYVYKLKNFVKMQSDLMYIKTKNKPYPFHIYEQICQTLHIKFDFHSIESCTCAVISVTRYMLFSRTCSLNYVKEKKLQRLPKISMNHVMHQLSGDRLNFIDECVKLKGIDDTYG
jgi:hypothetical protein